MSHSWRSSAAGLLLGACSAVLGPPALLLVALTMPVGRPAARGAVLRLAAVEHARIRALLGGEPGGGPPEPGRAARYLLARVPVGLLGGAILALLGLGAAAAVTMLWSWATATPWLFDPDAVITGRIVALNLLPGAVLLFLGIAGTATVVRWERALDRRLHAPTLRERVAELTASRADVVAAVDDERRRIERDLHDGVQQQLVALGMLLGRARRRPEQAADLVAQAHDAAQRALVELREVSWRVYPAALDADGLGPALAAVAERSPVPVDVRCAVGDVPSAVRVPTYFVVCEAVTNAAKHAAASRIDVEVTAVAGCLQVTVRDDGRGGADPRGGGLSGLARRVAAADGAFVVDSPVGGPTVVRAELPCPLAPEARHSPPAPEAPHSVPTPEAPHSVPTPEAPHNASPSEA